MRLVGHRSRSRSVAVLARSGTMSRLPMPENTLRSFASWPCSLISQAQVVDRIGVAQRVLVADEAALVEIEQRLVERLHAELARALHDLLDPGHVALEDQVRDQRRVREPSPPPPARGPARRGADQPLRDERADVERQIHQQLRAALLGEEVDDPVERLVGAVRVQRGEAQVAGLGERDSRSPSSRGRAPRRSGSRRAPAAACS